MDVLGLEAPLLSIASDNFRGGETVLIEQSASKVKRRGKTKARPDFSLIARTPLRLFQLASPVTL